MEPEPTFPEYFRRKNDDNFLIPWIKEKLRALLGEEVVRINILTKVIMLLIPLYDVRSIKFLCHVTHFLNNHAENFVDNLQAILISKCPLEKKRIVEEYRKNEVIEMIHNSRVSTHSLPGTSTSFENFQLELGYENSHKINITVVPPEKTEVMDRIIDEGEIEVLSVVYIPPESIEMQETKEK
ncbi:hypothetical protein NPIL_186751 [Nephila pilipes]|uniref:Uncharacterized protein n=1 Tax=Nephila pilipes TaxID=299642 RepID=A0A8X6MHI5_NEPPI|nr:hypothetical protein NPIL_186751 [Nephila pilipes]